MTVKDQGTLAQGRAGSESAVCIFPAVATLSDGTVLATYRAGSTKDCADESAHLLRSEDGGRTWSAPIALDTPMLDGKRGGLRVCYVTELSPGRLLAAAMWIDHETHPGQPLFNPETEGCLAMAIVLAESANGGRTWTPWRAVPMPDEIGPPSLTNPILKLPDGRLAMSIETNKHYLDSSKWYQRVVFFYSDDEGQSWSGPTVIAQDPTGRIFNWDQRACVAQDGRVATFAWTYDSEAKTYLNIHRRLSDDGGETWSPAEDLGITDQAGHPAVLPDGRVLLTWVDRFHSCSIRARLARDVAAPFAADTELTIYTHGKAGGRSDLGTTADTLSDMGVWSFGLPYAETLPDGDVMVVYYAGTQEQMDVRFARLGI